jgi:hypothetical protein
MFADVGGRRKANTFCYITNTAKEGRTLLTYLQTESHIGIGRAFMMINPTIVKRSKVKEQMVTVECNVPLIPLSTAFNRKLPAHPEIMIVLPELITNFVPRRPSCGGYLCDRKADYQANEACGCFSIGSSNIFHVVLE